MSDHMGALALLCLITGCASPQPAPISAEPVVSPGDYLPVSRRRSVPPPSAPVVERSPLDAVDAQARRLLDRVNREP